MPLRYAMIHSLGNAGLRDEWGAGSSGAAGLGRGGSPAAGTDRQLVQDRGPGGPYGHGSCWPQREG
jgi:hypothetical protein